MVLTVKDIDKTIAFYSEVLEMKIVEFGEGRRALKFGQQKINLHEVGKEFEPKAQFPTAGSIDLCFITEKSLPIVIDKLRKHSILIEEGPVMRTGAEGEIESVYIRDPDGNLIEISHYCT